ncbi:MAG: YdbL family protein [Chlorobiaceae bacterium]|nr:YdbL family protein [Chlorobiaceae bacterium]
MNKATINNFLRFLRGSTLLIAFLISCSQAVLALDLATARSKGLVGEIDSGYLAIPPGASGEAKPLVDTINSERRMAYASLAAKNGVTMEISGQLTFEKRYPAFPAGTWVQIQGKWLRKGM